MCVVATEMRKSSCPEVAHRDELNGPTGSEGPAESLHGARIDCSLVVYCKKIKPNEQREELESFMMQNM